MIHTDAEALELAIEEAWWCLQALGLGVARDVVLGRDGRVRLSAAPREHVAGFVGCYTGAITLADLREDVFDAFERGRL